MNALKCPEFSCDAKVEEEQLKELVSEQTYIKYCRFQNNKKVAADKMLFFCPTVDCESVITLR